MSVTSIDPDAPEAGWPPFMEWLLEHGIDPSLCWALDADDGENPRCVAHLYATDEQGKKYIVGGGDEARVAIREPVEFVASRPPPRRSE